MNTTQAGGEAEKKVAKILKSQGHKIVALNWRNRRCEIDVISKKDGCVYFTEVKYRSNDKWGDGFSYITPSKLKQMNFAAELWLAENSWSGECQLLGASVDIALNVIIVEI